MPSGVPGLGMIMSSAKPLGCHGSGSGRTPPISSISGNAALILRAAKMVLTCRPLSGATPTGNVRSTVRHLDAETNWPGAELELDCPSDVTDESATGAAATISKQHTATVSTTGATLPTTGSAASGWTSAPTAKNTAAGAMTAASSTGDLRRSLANSCRPTDSTVYQIVTFAARFNDPISRRGRPRTQRPPACGVRLTTVFAANTPYSGTSK